MEEVHEHCFTGMAGEYCRNMHRLRRLQVLERLIHIPAGEFMTMNVLSNEALMQNQEGMRVSELAKILENSPAASSKMLSVLEEKGYIERFFNHKDRRNTYVKLTAKGKEVLCREFSHIKDYVTELYRCLGKENCETLLRLQKQTLDITEKYLMQLKAKEESESC